MILKRRSTLLVASVALTVVLTGCSSSRFGPDTRTFGQQPQTLSPVQNSSVQSSSLPPLNGQNNTTASGTVFGQANDGFNSGDPALNSQVASADGSIVNINELGGSTTPGGRDLSGSLTPAKLLGVWTVSANLQTCRLNLTQTTKTGTSRYRASAPNCELPVLALVSSWQLRGSQVQLFDESGGIIGAMQLSGNRFIGTLSGGVAVTMTG